MKTYRDGQLHTHWSVDPEVAGSSPVALAELQGRSVRGHPIWLHMSRKSALSPRIVDHVVMKSSIIWIMCADISLYRDLCYSASIFPIRAIFCLRYSVSWGEGKTPVLCRQASRAGTEVAPNGHVLRFGFEPIAGAPPDDFAGAIAYRFSLSPVLSCASP